MVSFSLFKRLNTKRKYVPPVVKWVNEWLLFNASSAISQLYHGVERTNSFSMTWWWGPLCIKPTRLVGFYSANSLKQQSAGRHVALLGHIILILSQSEFGLSPYRCVLSGEARRANFIVFGLIRSGLEPTNYRTRGEQANNYTKNAVRMFWKT